MMSFTSPFTGERVWVEDPWVWPATGLLAAALYALPAGLVFLAVRRAAPRLRNLATIGVLVVYLLVLVAVLFGRRA